MIFLREIVIDLEITLIDVERATRREVIVVDDAAAGKGFDRGIVLRIDQVLKDFASAGVVVRGELGIGAVGDVLRQIIVPDRRLRKGIQDLRTSWVVIAVDADAGGIESEGPSGVVGVRAELAKITGTFRAGQCTKRAIAVHVEALSLVIGEKEQFVLEDRTTHCASEHVPAHGRFW